MSTLTRLAPLPDQLITVANPDDFMGSPAYEGLASEAHRHLVAGDYPATTSDGTSVRLVLSDFDAVLTLDLVELTARRDDLRAYFAMIYRTQRRTHNRAMLHPVGSPARQRLEHVQALLQARRDRTAHDLHAASAAIVAAGGCPSCIEGSPVPHTASSACRSGGRNHCTCDTCW